MQTNHPPQPAPVWTQPTHCAGVVTSIDDAKFISSLIQDTSVLVCDMTHDSEYSIGRDHTEKVLFFRPDTQLENQYLDLVAYGVAHRTTDGIFIRNLSAPMLCDDTPARDVNAVGKCGELNSWDLADNTILAKVSSLLVGNRLRSVQDMGVYDVVKVPPFHSGCMRPLVSESGYADTCIKIPLHNHSHAAGTYGLEITAQKHAVKCNGFMPFTLLTTLGNQSVALVMEFGGNTLQNTLKKGNAAQAKPYTVETAMPWAFTKNHFVECLDIVRNMHACGIAHMDMHLDNIVCKGFIDMHQSNTVIQDRPIHPKNINLGDSHFRIPTPINPKIIDLSRATVVDCSVRIKKQALVDKIEHRFSYQTDRSPYSGILFLFDLYALAQSAHRWNMEHSSPIGVDVSTLTNTPVGDKWLVDTMQKIKSIALKTMDAGKQFTLKDYDLVIGWIGQRLKSNTAKL